MKNYNFFAYLGRMKYIKRWSLMRSTVEETVMEHSEQVAQLVYALAYINNKVFGGNVNADRCVSLAVFHETPEVITGDLPTPIKYYNADIKTAYKNIEKSASDKLLSMLPPDWRQDFCKLVTPDIQTYEYRLIKAADKLSALIKCAEELKCGNGEFKKAYSVTKEDLERYDLPEVKYFMDNFYQGFMLTLDELD